MKDELRALAVCVAAMLLLVVFAFFATTHYAAGGGRPQDTQEEGKMGLVGETPEGAKVYRFRDQGSSRLLAVGKDGSVALR